MNTTNKGYMELRSTLTSMIDYEYENYIDIDDDVAADLATFVMTQGNSKEVGTPEFFAWAGEMTDRTGTVSDTTGLATDDTQLYVESTAGLRVGDILHFPTAGEDGDHVRITSVAAPLNISDLNTRTAAIATDAAFIILGEAAAFDSASSATATYREPTKVTNYTQLIRRSVHWDETELASDVETKASRMEQKSSWLRKEFRKDLGFTYWFGRSSQDASTSGGYQTTKGIVVQLANGSGVTSANEGGALAYATVSGIVEGLAEWAKYRNYKCYHGELALGGLADLGTTARVGNQDRKGPYGYAGQSISVSNFTLDMVYERILQEAGAPYNGYMFFIDPKCLSLHHLTGKKFTFQQNIQDDPGGEIVKHQMKTNSGLGITWEKRHGFIRGIS